jgi:hypothetical protein
MIHKLEGKDVTRKPAKPKPKPSAEYVLVYDYPFGPTRKGEPKEIRIPAFTVVLGVIKCENDGLYWFTVKETGIRYQGTWSGECYALNTPENLSRLRVALSVRQQYFDAKKEMRRAFLKVKRAGEE